MILFEFYMTIAAVIIAIGVSEIVSGWGRLLRSPIVIEIDWLYLSWTAVIVIIAMLYWIGMWPYRDYKFEYVGQVLFLAIPTLFLVLLSYAITPEIPKHGPFSLRKYYFERRKPIFFSLLGYLVMSFIADLIIAKYNLVIVEIAIVFILAIFYLVLSFTERVWVHVTITCIISLYYCMIGFLPLDEIFSRL